MQDSTDPNEINRRSYEAIARGYAGDVPSEEDPTLRARTRQLFMERLRGPRILELGCGPGTDGQKLLEAGLNVTAIDYSQTFSISQKSVIHSSTSDGWT